MEERDRRKISGITEHIYICLVVLGQVLIFLGFTIDTISAYCILPAFAASAVGLGIGAQKTGRSVVGWAIIGLIFPIGMPLVGIAVMVFGKRKDGAQKEPVRLSVHIVAAAIIFAVAAFVMDSFSLAFMGTVAGVIWGASGKQVTARQKLLRAGIYIIAFAMVLAVKAVNDRVSRNNAGVIIAACDAYRNKTGTYPQALNDLVPAYLPKVPAARLSLMSPNFRYYRESGDLGDNYRLLYVSEEPFGRQVYSSARKAWRSID